MLLEKMITSFGVKVPDFEITQKLFSLIEVHFPTPHNNKRRIFFEVRWSSLTYYVTTQEESGSGLSGVFSFTYSSSSSGFSSDY